MTTLGYVNSFDFWFLRTLLEHALVKHMSEPTRFDSKQRSSLLDSVATHVTGNTANLNILSPSANSDHAVLSRMFGACDII